MLKANLNGFHYNKHNCKVSFTLKLINTSYVTAENINFVLKISGVKDVTKPENSYLLSDGEFSYTSRRAGDILVQGIENSMLFEFTPLYNFFYIEVIYYCKDCKAEYKVALAEIFDYDVKIEKVFKSSNEVNESSKQEIHEEYQNKKENFELEQPEW